MGHCSQKANWLDGSTITAILEDQENKEASSRPTKKMQTLTPVERPLSLETAEKRIYLSINDNTELRRDLMDRCEMVVRVIIQQLCAGEVPKLFYRIPTVANLTEQIELSNSQKSTKSLECYEGGQSTVFDSPESMETDGETLPGRINVVDFSRNPSKKPFARMMTVMSKVYNLLRQNETQTRRSLFYELKSHKSTSAVVDNQQTIDFTVKCLANLLECSHRNTGLVGTVKGLVAGNLTLTFANKDKINCDTSGGILIPQNLTSLTSIRTKANRVIVVEKDTVFQKILQDKCPQILNCIVITGKGYPDVLTRMLVNILAEKVRLPVYILVDADPWGMDIMFNYKYGSVRLFREQENLACPSACWIGIHPSELEHTKVSKLPLTDLDVRKLNDLRTRPYIDDEYVRELDVMRNGKAEIEAMTDLTSWYIPIKVGISNIKLGSD